MNQQQVQQIMSAIGDKSMPEAAPTPSRKRRKPSNDRGLIGKQGIPDLNDALGRIPKRR